MEKRYDRPKGDVSVMSVDEIWDQVGKGSGVLTDEDIILLGTRKLLVGGFEISQVRQTYYELRVGHVIYRHLADESKKKETLAEGGRVHHSAS